MSKRKLPVPSGYRVGELENGKWYGERVDASARSDELTSRYSAVHWCLADALKRLQGKPEPTRKPLPRSVEHRGAHSSGAFFLNGEDE